MNDVFVSKIVNDHAFWQTKQNLLYIALNKATAHPMCSKGIYICFTRPFAVKDRERRSIKS